MLVATQDRHVEEMLLSLLDAESYSVDFSKKGSEVLLMIMEKDIDLVVLDLDLLGMTGMEILPIIRKSKPHLPVIVIGEDYSIKTAEEIAKEGVLYYLLKPVDGKELGQLIKAAKDISDRKKKIGH